MGGWDIAGQVAGASAVRRRPAVGLHHQLLIPRPLSWFLLESRSRRTPCLPGGNRLRGKGHSTSMQPRLGGIAWAPTHASGGKAALRRTRKLSICGWQRRRWSERQLDRLRSRRKAGPWLGAGAASKLGGGQFAGPAGLVPPHDKRGGGGVSPGPGAVRDFPPPPRPSSPAAPIHHHLLPLPIWLLQLVRVLSGGTFAYLARRRVRPGMSAVPRLASWPCMASGVS